MMKKNLLIFSLFISVLMYSYNSEYMQARIRNEINKGVESWNKYRKKAPIAWEIGLFFAQLDNRDLSGINLSNFRIYNCSFINTKFIRAILEEAKFSACKIQNTDFSYSNLNNANINWNLQDSRFISISFNNGLLDAEKITNCNFSNSTMRGARFSVSRILYSDFFNCDLKNISIEKESFFLNCNFTNSDFQSSKFLYTQKDRIEGYGKVKFNHCNFTNANLTSITQLDNAAFNYSNMKGTKIERKWFNYLKTQKVKNFELINWQ